MQRQIRTISSSDRFETSFINVFVLKPRLYRMNCYFCESSLIFTTRLFYRLKTSPINASALKPRLYRINSYFCKSSLIPTSRYYPQSPRHIISPRPQMLFINYQRLMRYYNHYYHNFQGFFEAFEPKQCPSKQRPISLSQFINCLKRPHAGVSQPIAYISV